MLRRSIVAALMASFAASGANAATMTIGDVTFDTDNAAVSATIAQGGHFVGPPDGRREAGDPVPEIVGFDLSTYWEIDKNGPSHPDDVLAVSFASALANGAGNCAAGDYAGCDVLVFEVLNQPDSPTVSLSLGGAMILGVLLADTTTVIDGDTKRIGIYGFDFSLLSVAIGDVVNNPVFLSRPESGEGTPDVAAIVGMNFFSEPPPPEIPVPAAAPLFFAGLAGLAFARRRRRRS